MKIRSWGYFLGESFRSIFRNGWMSFASVGVVAITLLILGSFMLVNENVEYLSEEVKGQVEIAVWVEEDASKSEIDELRVELIKMDQTEEVRFVPKKEGLERMKDQLGREAVAGYDDPNENPLPDLYEVSTYDPEDVPQVADNIANFQGVENVDYGSSTVETLFQVTDAVKLVAYTFMIALAFTATFLIANTIKLTVYSRKEEIKIMKLVGATNWFIRWPFLLEGLLLGFLGSIIPVGILRYGYTYLTQWVYQHAGFISLQSPEMVFQWVDVVLILLGTLLGGIGSITSLRKFLRV